VIKLRKIGWVGYAERVGKKLKIMQSHVVNPEGIKKFLKTTQKLVKRTWLGLIWQRRGANCGLL
jgi:hypothetical protein